MREGCRRRHSGDLEVISGDVDGADHAARCRDLEARLAEERAVSDSLREKLAEGAEGAARACGVLTPLLHRFIYDVM